MKHSLIALLLLTLAGAAGAGLADYTFVQTPGSYGELTAPVTIHGPGVDEALSAPLPIGFSFVYDGVAYTQFRASSNGFITLDLASAASGANHLDTQPLILAPFWDDLKTDDANSNVSYQLTGSEPNRVLTAQFKNLRWYYTTVPANLVNFQIRLFETDNRVEFTYGLMGTAPGALASATIGISGAAMGDFISVTPFSPQAIVSHTVENDLIDEAQLPHLANRLYSFIPPGTRQHDLAAVSLTGNPTPSEGTPTTHTVTVRNLGLVTEAVYSVKLIDGAGTELATAPGLTVSPLQTVMIPLAWTPQIAGAMTIFGKVVLAGDENSANDQTPPLNLSVQQEIPSWNGIVGSGNELARVPVDMYYKNSLFETLYYASELAELDGQITALRFFNDFYTTYLNDMPTKIWLGITNLPDLSAGWITSGQLTLVFDGTMDYPEGEQWIQFNLLQPFAYTGQGNLVLLAQRPLDTAYYASSDYFRCQTWGTNRARKAQSDSTVLDPANPAMPGALSGQFPMTGFVYVPYLYGSLEGTVRSANNQPLAGATVQVLNTAYNAVTNASGEYGLQLPEGIYSVTASAANGYIAQTVEGVSVTGDQVTVQDFVLAAVAAADGAVPAIPTGLTGIRPNPFKLQAEISYSLKEAMPARLAVYDLRGRKVRELAGGELAGGEHRCVWDGRDGAGRPVSSGVYLLKLEAGSYRDVRKLMLVK